MRIRSIVKAFTFATLVAGCTGTGTGSVTYSGEVSTPQMVEIEPGVQVIADYDEPVFYSDNYYWRAEGGVWYRSNDYRRGWVRYENAPERVRHIERPQAYVHYHGGARVNGGGYDRDHRSYQPQPQPEVRDHRDYQPQPQPYVAPQPVVRDHREPERAQPQPYVAPQPQPEPAVRDHRDMGPPRHEEKVERREERHDAHDQRKEEKREEKRDDKGPKERDHRH